MQKQVKEIIESIKALEKGGSADCALPQNTYYLGDGKILSMPRRVGESRFPYDSDGFVVWAYQTGFISACDSTFTILRSANFGEESPVAFFGGVQREDGSFFPYSVTGASRQLDEPSDTRRYVVFSLRSVYYIVDTDDITFACRMFVTKSKDIRFSVTAENKSDRTKNVYLASFVEALLRFSESEGFWDRMSKFAKRYSENSVVLWSRNGREDCLVVNSEIIEGNVKKACGTVARSVFLGFKGRNITNAESLKSGEFDRDVPYVTTTDLPVASDILHFELAAGESCRADWQLSVRHGMEEAEAAVGKIAPYREAEREIDCWEAEDSAVFDNMRISFGDWNTDKINPAVMNKFCRNIQKQVSFCALGKNYAGPHIGIRDVFQQLEGALMWDSEKSREKILVAMNYIMSNGRAPRQFSIAQSPEQVPDFDLRMYIDQGVWVISTIYTYICFTDDWSILDEECGYFDLLDEYTVAHSNRRDSVLCHLVNICDFLASKLDRENTWCMRALYGDWNDALDGLGKTSDPGRDFGDGVSVMTSLQYYQNLAEMRELLSHVGGYDEKIAEYGEIRGKLEAGLFKWAVERNEDGVPRVIHGWGDKMAYKVGSYHDCDGKSRYSLTANSFWAISGIMEKDSSIKASLMGCVDAVDSKYGLMTFDKPFTLADRPYIGRLATIVEGTYENCCAYVHASMFGIMALFLCGESRRAWREMEKSIVITHDNCTMTPFVMPNSWCRNEALGIDGDSMGDWYTGSGTVFIKELVRFGFGIAPTLDSLVIQTPSYMPTTEASIDISIKGHPITLKYRRDGEGERVFRIDGKVYRGEFDALMNTEKLTVNSGELHDGMVIEVIDCDTSVCG